MSATLKDISAVAREWRWKSGRRVKGGGDRDAEDSEDGSGSHGTDTGYAQVGE